MTAVVIRPRDLPPKDGAFSDPCDLEPGFQLSCRRARQIQCAALARLICIGAPDQRTSGAVALKHYVLAIERREFAAPGHDFIGDPQPRTPKSTEIVSPAASIAELLQEFGT